MAFRYVVAGRRPLPRHETTWSFELDDPEGSDLLEEGSLEVSEIERKDNEEYFETIEAIVGFAPVTLLNIRPAAWDMSRIAAEVLAEALDGNTHVDAFVAEEGIEYVPARNTSPAASIEELEQRIRKAHEKPKPFFKRWEKLALQKRAEWKAKNPEAAAEDAAREKNENDWSDL